MNKITINFIHKGIYDGATTADGKKEWRGGETPYNKALQAGTAQWQDGVNGIVACLAFTCPCGCGSIGTLPVAAGYSRMWNWDGNRELPTLTPSIQKLTPCKWHGYLTKGEFSPC